MAIWEGLKDTLSEYGGCLDATCTPLASTLRTVVTCVVWRELKWIVLKFWSVTKWIALKIWAVLKLLWGATKWIVNKIWAVLKLLWGATKWIVNKIWTAVKRVVQVIWAVLKWVAKAIFATMEWLATAIWNLLRGINPIDDEYKAYHSLLALCIALVLINLADVWCMEQISLMSPRRSKVVIYAPPSTVLAFWACIMILWIFENLKAIPKNWTQNQNEYRKKLGPRLGIIFGTLVAVLVCQFVFLPLYALPQYRKVEWQLNYENTESPIAPMVLLTTNWAAQGELNISVGCDAEGGCNTDVIESTNYQWVFLIDYLQPLTLNITGALVLNVYFTAQQSRTAYGSGPAAYLQYVFIDPIFRDNIPAALTGEDSRYPVGEQYPWNSTRSLLANIEQITVDDSVNSLNWSTHDEYPKYNYYTVHATPDITNPYPPTDTCLEEIRGTCGLTLQLSIGLQSVLSEVRRSEPGIKEIDIMIYEGAIVGGFSFLALFFQMYGMA